MAMRLLRPHRSYLPVIRPLLGKGLVKGMAHITGGGITDNLPRILPEGCGAGIDRSAWEVPALFKWLQRQGSVPDEDMLRTFNMGIGLIVICGRDDAGAVMDMLAPGEPGALRIGEIRTAPVSDTDSPTGPAAKSIGILISGRGSNMQALIRAVEDGRLDARIAVVISNRPEAPGLEHARQAGIETLVVDHRQFKSHDFDRASRPN